MSNLVAGTKVWVRDDEDAFLLGTVKTSTGSQIEVVTEKGQVVRKHPRDADFETCGSHVDNDMENLVDLDEFSEGAILHHIRKRFRKRSIYTHVGAILVAVNPFETLDIYGVADMKRAQSSVTAAPYPHVFLTAATAYSQLCLHKKNQSVLISGESGAGKTETTKKVLQYLANVAPGAARRGEEREVGLEEKILRSNPLLEAMGNAKTLRNNNSSRFGKWMKVRRPTPLSQHLSLCFSASMPSLESSLIVPLSPSLLSPPQQVDFDAGFRIQGCEIVNYLLEKSRVVAQTKGERSYHIFYQVRPVAFAFGCAAPALYTPTHLFPPFSPLPFSQLLAGADGDLRSALRLLPPAQYRYLRESGCTAIEGVDDAGDFAEVRAAMSVLLLSEGQQRAMWQLVAAVLLLGNVAFVEDGAGYAAVDAASRGAVQEAEALLGLSGLARCLQERHIEINRERTAVRYSRGQAEDNRDAVAKVCVGVERWSVERSCTMAPQMLPPPLLPQALYSNLFDWTIRHVNSTLRTEGAPLSIGVLDIFGFEVRPLLSTAPLVVAVLCSSPSPPPPLSLSISGLRHQRLRAAVHQLCQREAAIPLQRGPLALPPLPQAKPLACLHAPLTLLSFLSLSPPPLPPRRWSSTRSCRCTRTRA